MLTVQIKFVLHPCGPILINNHNVACNSVEKCFAAINVKLQVKRRVKTFCSF